MGVCLGRDLLVTPRNPQSHPHNQNSPNSKPPFGRQVLCCTFAVDCTGSTTPFAPETASWLAHPGADAQADGRFEMGVYLRRDLLVTPRNAQLHPHNQNSTNSKPPFGRQVTNDGR